MWTSGDFACRSSRRGLKLRTYQVMTPMGLACPFCCSDALGFILIPLNFFRKKIWQSHRELTNAAIMVISFAAAINMSL